MSKPKIRNAGNRSRGGRPAQQGERTPGGRLKAPGPNQLVVDRRKAMCDDITKASNPLDAAHYRGWLSSADFDTAQRYARLHRLAGFGTRGRAAGASLEVDKPIEVSLDPSLGAKSFFSALPHAEIVRLWDAVFDDDGVGRQRADARAAAATVSWKLVNAAMTASERAEVNLVCIEQSFPQWILQRAAGRMETSWEAKRGLLISGLEAIRRALLPPTQAANRTLAVPDPVVKAEPAMRVIEREVRTENGRPVLEVERVSPRRA